MTLVDSKNMEFRRWPSVNGQYKSEPLARFEVAHLSQPDALAP